MFIILDYSSALEYSIIRRYTNIVYYYLLLLLSFNNNCKLNKIDGQGKILMFEMCLSGASKCWYLTLSDLVKKDLEIITEQFNHDYLQNNQWLNTTRLENRKLQNT